jgi:aspartyl-tRNA synthetase
MSYRTHHCNELRKSHVGETAKLIGWVNTKRDHHGVIFIDIRDREGVTQAVFRTEENAEAAALSHTLRHEDVVQDSSASALRSRGNRPSTRTSTRARSRSSPRS